MGEIMNTPNNTRSTASKTNIHAAFVKLLGRKAPKDISVQEICKMAGVNRTTFYTYFANIQDLMETIESDLYIEAEKQTIPKTSDIPLLISCGFFVSILNFIRQHEAIYRIYFSQNSEARLFNEIEGAINSVFIRALTSNKNYSESEFAYIFEFGKAGTVGIIKKWLFSGCKEPNSILAEQIEKMLQRCLQ